MIFNLSFLRRRKMGLFSGISPMSFVFNAALAAATGGASLAVTIQQMAIKAAVQIAIQQFGEQMGLPQSIIDIAKNMAMGQMGGAAADFSNPAGNALNFSGSPQDFLSMISGGSATQQGAIARGMDMLREAINGVSEQEGSLDKILEDALQNGNLKKEKSKFSEEVSRVMNGKGSLLLKIAMILGMIADEKMEKMAEKTKEIGQLGEIDKKNQAKYSQLSGEIQALGQEMSIVSQAMSNVIKTIGESAAAIARKG
jgi:hypothetical protein